MALGHTPSQTVGPFFAFGLNNEGSEVMVSDATQGERIRIEGRVIDGDGTAVSDAMIEIWQANAAGRYDHPGRFPQRKAARPGLSRLRPLRHRQGRPLSAFSRSSRARCPESATRCRRRISTLRYLRAACSSICGRGSTSRAKSLNADDPVLALVAPERRKTLIARRPNGKEPGYAFDVVLQGKGETVFFDV